MAKVENIKLLTPDFRAAWVYVFDADDNGKHSLTMLFPPGENLIDMKKAAHEAAVNKWGANGVPKNLHSPFHDQGEKDYDGYTKGAIYITATNKNKPGVVDQNVQDIIDKSEFYSGCWARAQVRAYAWEFPNEKGVIVKRGVSFSLENVQKVRDDEPFGAKRDKASDAFAPVDIAEGQTPEDIFQ